MKLSTYLMTGAIAVGLVACVGTTLWINSKLFVPTEIVELSGESVDRQVGQFSSIESTAEDIEFCRIINDNSQYIIQNLNANISIVENDSITLPSVTTYPALGNIVMVNLDGEVLHIDYFPDSLPAADGQYITYVCKIDVPVTVTVPRGMLKSLKGGPYTRFTIDGVVADSLEIDVDRKIILDNSRIGLLTGSISDALVIRKHSDIAECRLNVYGEDFSLKSENDSRFGSVQILDCDPATKLDISQATIGELSTAQREAN